MRPPARLIAVALAASLGTFVADRPRHRTMCRRCGWWTPVIVRGSTCNQKVDGARCDGELEVVPA